MESSSLVDDCLSPESTVTSLLSSSGHLRSSLRPPEHDTTFKYRDKDYDSASAALDAYIIDFERSCQNCRSLTGSLVLPHGGPSTPTKPRVGSLRNQDVLRERLTDRELDFLNLPVSSLHHRSNRDRFSMTTNELLSIPYDGSMPVTHTSAFIQASQSFPSTIRPPHRTSAGLRSQAASYHLNQTSAPTRAPSSSRYRGRAVAFNPAVDASSSAHRAANLHLPRWLTSNKADMDCSEISSMPDLKYPAWIQRCDISEPDLWDERVSPPTGAHRTGAPSWVSDLEKDDVPDDIPAQVENQQTLRDLRLQLAEQISLLASERTGSDTLTALFRENRIESLIQKADQVLNSLSQSSGRAESPADPVSPVNTEDLLVSQPPRRPPVTLDSAAGGIEAAPAGRDVEGWGCGFHGNSIWKQPGPVEAVKQMLFRLQAVEAELQRQQKEPAGLLQFTNDLKTPEKQLVDHDAEFQRFSGTPSLQRALHHLNRLKLLVEEPRPKHREEGEEKEEDEGRYSSSSADRLVSSQREPS